MVPGHMVGENRKEQLAVIKQPKARPALLWLRRVTGRAKSVAEAIDATVNNIRTIEDVENVNGYPNTVAVRVVISARNTPALREMSMSSAEAVSTERSCVPFSDRYRLLVFNGGKGGCSTSEETASARYPKSMFVREL